MGTANDYTHTEGEGKSITYSSSIQSTIGQQKIKGQSTKSDTIYRADAIKAIEDMQDCYNGFSGTYDKAQIIGVLEDVPTAEPQWIPWNSGRFPAESGTYTVTAYDGATERVTYAKYQKRLKRWELTGARAYWRVLAWMPLPKPYKGETDG